MKCRFLSTLSEVVITLVEVYWTPKFHQGSFWKANRKQVPVVEMAIRAENGMWCLILCVWVKAFAERQIWVKHNAQNGRLNSCVVWQKCLGGYNSKNYICSVAMKFQEEELCAQCTWFSRFNFGIYWRCEMWSLLKQIHYQFSNCFAKMETCMKAN